MTDFIEAIVNDVLEARVKLRNAFRQDVIDEMKMRAEEAARSFGNAYVDYIVSGVRQEDDVVFVVCHDNYCDNGFFFHGAFRTLALAEAYVLEQEPDESERHWWSIEEVGVISE